MAEAKEETDLENRFMSAAKYLESVTTQLDSSQLLELYSYYKQATQGKCNIARPSWFNMTARQKWDAWNGLGDLTQEEAMKKYIALIIQLFPDWDEIAKDKSDLSGWVAVSRMVKEESALEDSEKTLSDWVQEGDKVKVEQFAKDNKINELDEEGLGPIHWAADRGNLDMVRLLVKDLEADVDLKDQDGQTALHYAASCGHVDIVKYLITNGANTAAQDTEGQIPLNVATDADIVTLLS